MKNNTLKLLLVLFFTISYTANAQMPSFREGKIKSYNYNTDPTKSKTESNSVLLLKDEKSKSDPTLQSILTKYDSKQINQNTVYTLKSDQKLSESENKSIEDKAISIDSTDSYFYEYHENNKKMLEDEIKELKNKKTTSEYKVSLLKQNELKVALDKKNKLLNDYITLLESMEKTIRDENKYPTWLPSSNKDKYKFYEYMYSANKKDSVSFINNAGVQLGDKTTTVESELVSSFIGPFRVSFGTLVANSNTDSNGTSPKVASSSSTNSTTSAFQRLRANGGNTYLNLDYPVYCFTSSLFTLYSNLYSRGSLVFTNVSNDVDTTSGNGSTGCNLYASVASDDKKFIFFLNGNYSIHYGSAEYYQKLNLKEEKAFGFGQLTVGVNITKLFRVAYTFKTIASDQNLRTDKGVLGIQFLIK